MDEYTTDVVVIGSGGAGLRAATAAREEGCSVVVLSKCSPGLATCTAISNGAFGSSGFGLSEDEYYNTTMEVGYHLNNPSLVRVLSEEAPLRLQELEQKGVRFKESHTGVVVLRRPPDSGREAVDALLNWGRTCGVHFINWFTVARLTTENGRVTGCVAIGKDGHILTIHARAVIICTGGASAIYKFHDNPSTILGDGYALAHQAGALLRDMEFIQFYPLIAIEPHAPKTLIQPFLGDLGQIINDKGEDLLEKYDLTKAKPVAIKARDRLSRAMFKEYLQGSNVYLDVRALPEDKWSHPFAHNVRETFVRYFRADTKPVRMLPVAHFTIGGCVIDDWGNTSAEGLFAAGESACGLHGANRMGGNALSETLVFGYRAGVSAARYAKETRQTGPGKAATLFSPTPFAQGKWKPAEALGALREIMWNDCGPIRTRDGLTRALEKIDRLTVEGVRCVEARELSMSVAVTNCLSTARAIAEGALERKESVGAHYRED
jgi:fumarate reductase (CoM/CoB) subunit A